MAVMPLDMGTPSITNSAVLLSMLTVDSPRSVTRSDPPGPEEAWSKLRPATLPERASSQLFETAAVKSWLSTFDTAYPSAFCSRVIPSAVTTMPSIASAFGCIVTSRRVFPPPIRCVVCS